MRKKTLVVISPFALLLAAGLWITQAEAEYKGAPPPAPKVVEKPVNVALCYDCHDTIKELHNLGKHAKVNCINCHTGLAVHLANPGPATRPGTDTSWEACGSCHKDQYDSFMKVALHRPARDEKSQLTNRAPNPFWDKLMAGHGFTKEHALTRSHVNMLPDHLIVDRAYGGRFQAKEGWEYVLEKGRAWDILTDTQPGSKEHKPFMPQSAAAANPVCLQCKSQDQILKWGYMGDKVEGKTTWDRTSNVVDFVKDLNHGLNCFTCHDPHAAKPRIVRDGLIAALTRPEADTLWHKDAKHTNMKIYDMGLRGFPRKIAILEKYDTSLQCGQCHVEYNCNPGTDAKTGEPVKMTDQRTNHFPYKDVFGLYDHYKNQVNFLDFKHALTGGMLWKAQHPEAESYYNSKHAKAGAGCDTCHTPKVKNKQGKVYTSHFAVTPRVQIKETCLTAKCHPKWTEEEAKYTIDSIKAHIKGKMRKAEFRISVLIDKIVAAKAAGVAPEVIKKAQDHHLKAHILWEYWTAENSDGFHNPDLAKESLLKSAQEAFDGIKVIDDAMAPKTAATAPTAGK
ncbi:MAG: ammonia-forming cytochrome c nitrite reductase subunit c552 [Desulfobulbaceae bacterium]|nr:ammonia-forming cytochrome c nitrite reductase subunit c552 [Desulfobulbaceae bacterium]